MIALSFFSQCLTNNSRAWALISQTLPKCPLSIAAVAPRKPAISLDVEDTIWAHYTDNGKLL
jgi:hypothetical protein